jgi:hypothetical protein
VLAGAGGEFARLAREFGGSAEQAEEDEAEAAEAAHAGAAGAAAIDAAKHKAAGAGTGKLEGRLIITEKRTTGSVGWGIYLEYLKVPCGARGRVVAGLTWRSGGEGRDHVPAAGARPRAHAGLDHGQLLHARVVGEQVSSRRAVPCRAS